MAMYEDIGELDAVLLSQQTQKQATDASGIYEGSYEGGF